MNKYTKGPWIVKVDEKTQVQYIGPKHPTIEGYLKIGVCLINTAEKKPTADACLIASAPELLEVCKALLAAAGYNPETKCWNIGPMRDMAGGKMEMLQQVIIKAEGRS